MDPPRFRREQKSSTKNCGSCDRYADMGAMGICSKYERPVYPIELCDSYLSKFTDGRRQAAQP